jgi:hypothetical protein
MGIKMHAVDNLCLAAQGQPVMAATACCRTMLAQTLASLGGQSKVPAQAVLHHVQRLDDGSFVVQLVLQPRPFQQGLNLQVAKQQNPSLSDMQKSTAIGSVPTFLNLKPCDVNHT